MATDLLMMFTKGRDAVPAECQAALDSNDTLMKGFVAGRFFEVDDFDFGVSVSDSDAPRRKRRSEHDDDDDEPRQGKFSKWVRDVSQSASVYPVLLDEVSVSRQVDKASVPFFYSCFRTTSFDSATLIKRKVTGVSKATPLGLYTYLRIDFNAVLITDVGWSISEAVVKEKLKFVCRKVSVQYRPQNNDGTVGDTMGGEWLSMLKAS